MTQHHILRIFLMVYIVFTNLKQDIFMEHSAPDACISRYYKLQSKL